MAESALVQATDVALEILTLEPSMVSLRKLVPLTAKLTRLAILADLDVETILQIAQEELDDIAKEKQG